MQNSHSKRKEAPQALYGGSALKRRKEGSGGRWKTPAQTAKQNSRIEMGTVLNVGDEGIWVTYARGMKGKAVREFTELCEQYGERMYQIKRFAESGMQNSTEVQCDEEDHDIESAIEQELSGMKTQGKPSGAFSPISVGIECVFFMKTMKPVDPIRLVRQICEDAKQCSDPMQRRCRYINRLTPVMDMEKATEKGINRVARRVLTPWFNLKDDLQELVHSPENAERENATDANLQTDEVLPDVTYAIRHSIRNHTALRSIDVINMIADMVKPEHKVNLTNPDKVILVEIFQLFCGISVVDGRNWEDLKRYNINALYGMTSEQKSGTYRQDRAIERTDAS